MKKDPHWIVFEKPYGQASRQIGSTENVALMAMKLGRSGKADIVFGQDNRNVSRHQFDLEKENKKWSIRNVSQQRVAYQMGSHSGKLKPDETLELRSKCTFVFQDTELVLMPASSDQDRFLRIMHHRKLVYNEQLPSDRVITVGRDADNDVVVDADEISKKHFSLAYSKDQGRIVLEDLESRNGVFVKQKREIVRLIRPQEVECGQEILFGCAKAVVLKSKRDETFQKVVILCAALLVLLFCAVVFKKTSSQQTMQVRVTQPQLRQQIEEALVGSDLHAALLLMEPVVHDSSLNRSQRKQLKNILSVLEKACSLSEATHFLNAETQRIRLGFRKNAWTLGQVEPSVRVAEMNRDLKHLDEALLKLPDRIDELQVKSTALLRTQVEHVQQRAVAARGDYEQAIVEKEWLANIRDEWFRTNKELTKDDIAMWYDHAALLDRDMAEKGRKTLVSVRRTQYEWGRQWEDVLKLLSEKSAGDFTMKKKDVMMRIQQYPDSWQDYLRKTCSPELLLSLGNALAHEATEGGEDRWRMLGECEHMVLLAARSNSNHWTEHAAQTIASQRTALKDMIVKEQSAAAAQLRRYTKSFKQSPSEGVAIIMVNLLKSDMKMCRSARGEASELRKTCVQAEKILRRQCQRWLSQAAYEQDTPMKSNRRDTVRKIAGAMDGCRNEFGSIAAKQWLLLHKRSQQS